MSLQNAVPLVTDRKANHASALAGADIVLDLFPTKHHMWCIDCRCASVSIVREDAVTDGRPPFTTYETMVSKKAFENFSQKYMSSATSSTRSMTHAASASDLAGMGEPQSFRQTSPQQKSIEEDEVQ